VLVGASLAALAFVIYLAHAGHTSQAGKQPKAQQAVQALLSEPQTIAATSIDGDVQTTLAINPVAPGTNQFIVKASEGGHDLDAGVLRVRAAMPGMLMQPFQFGMHALPGGYYQTTGQLSMYGGWQITVEIRKPGHAPYQLPFALSLTAPKPALQAGKLAGTS